MLHYVLRMYTCTWKKTQQILSIFPDARHVFSIKQEKSLNLYVRHPKLALDRSTSTCSATGAAVACAHRPHRIIHTQHIHCGSSVSLMWKPVSSAGPLQPWVKIPKLKHQNNIAAGRINFEFTEGTLMNGKRVSALFLVTLLITKGDVQTDLYLTPCPVDFNTCVNFKQFYA